MSVILRRPLARMADVEGVSPLVDTEGATDSLYSVERRHRWNADRPDVTFTHLRSRRRTVRRPTRAGRPHRGHRRGEAEPRTDHRDRGSSSEPGLDDAWFLPLTEQESNAKRQSEAALDVVGLDLAGPVRPLMHGAGFPDVSDEGVQPRGQQLSEFTGDGIERLARCFDVRSAVRPSAMSNNVTPT